MRVTPVAYKIEQWVMGEKMVSATATSFWGVKKKINNLIYFS